ncbi:MAG TPA: porin [Woeseiaceae bacterium]|nr:porin [Woeseiaceae bacterium]
MFNVFRFGLIVLTILHAGIAANAQEKSGVEAGAGGFSLNSADGEWRLRLRGLVQLDGRYFTEDSAPDDDSEWLLRRVRPSFEGQFGERISFRIMPEFAGSTQLIDAWIETKLNAGLRLRAGKFKSPVGLERLQSSNDLRIVERSFVTELLPNRDIGVQLSGGSTQLNWAVGVFNGVNDGRSADQDDDGQPDFALRLFSEPLHANSNTRFSVGIGASFGRTEGSAATPLLSGYRSAGQNTLFGYRSGAEGTFADGERLRLSPQFYWYRGPIGFLGEWARVRQDVRRTSNGLERSGTLDHEAWQVTAEWYVTGEAAGYRDASGAIGAVQFVARLSELRVDEDAFAGGVLSFADPADGVRKALTQAVGINWFPIVGLKASLAFHHSTFTGGDVDGDRADEDVIFVRLQHGF